MPIKIKSASPRKKGLKSANKISLIHLIEMTKQFDPALTNDDIYRKLKISRLGIPRKNFDDILKDVPIKGQMGFKFSRKKNRKRSYIALEKPAEEATQHSQERDPLIEMKVRFQGKNYDVIQVRLSQVPAFRARGFIASEKGAETAIRYFLGQRLSLEEIGKLVGRSKGRMSKPFKTVIQNISPERRKKSYRSGLETARKVAHRLNLIFNIKTNNPNIYARSISNKLMADHKIKVTEPTINEDLRKLRGSVDPHGEKFDKLNTKAPSSIPTLRRINYFPPERKWKIAIESEPTLRKIAAKFSLSGALEREDLVRSAQLKVVEKLDFFDPVRKKANLNAFIGRVARNHMVDLVEKEQRKKNIELTAVMRGNRLLKEL